MNELRVTNKHAGRWPHRKYVYIGRGSILGNQFRIGTHGSREEVIRLYKNWIYTQLDGTNRALEEELYRIIDLVLNGDQPVCLECYCKPAACHGDVIVEIINAAIQRMRK
jgi:Domain of unknown function (DUF4326)